MHNYVIIYSQRDAIRTLLSVGINKSRYVYRYVIMPEIKSFKNFTAISMNINRVYRVYLEILIIKPNRNVARDYFLHFYQIALPREEP